MREITIKLIFDETWETEEGDEVCAELMVEDAIRELAAGVKYEIVENNQKNAEQCAAMR